MWKRSGIHHTIEPGSPGACGLIIDYMFAREGARSQSLQQHSVPLGAQSARSLKMWSSTGCLAKEIVYTSSLWRGPSQCVGPMGGSPKKLFTLLDLCVSSLRRGHANLLYIVPILTDDPRRESKGKGRDAVNKKIFHHICFSVSCSVRRGLCHRSHFGSRYNIG